MKTADIKGYNPLSQEQVDAINRIKELEEDVAGMWLSLCEGYAVDQRDLALARTYLEDGFIRLVRAVATPTSPYFK